MNYIDSKEVPRNKILIGQAHGHPESDDPNTYTVKTMSPKDINTSQNTQVPIYGVNAMFPKSNVGKSTNINRANPNGTVDNNVGNTIGTGKHATTTKLNIGADALRIWCSSGTPKF